MRASPHVQLKPSFSAASDAMIPLGDSLLSFCQRRTPPSVFASKTPDFTTFAPSGSVMSFSCRADTNSPDEPKRKVRRSLFEPAAAICASFPVNRT